MRQRRLLLVGPPGAGKTMLARKMAKALPAPPKEEIYEVDEIMLAGGLRGPGSSDCPNIRPFRAPHHTASVQALVGTWRGKLIKRPQPGEATLAHHGTLLIDELPEFSKHALESLYTVLRDGENILRTTDGIVARLPALPVLIVCAMNPCPCGYHGTDERLHRKCSCTEAQIKRYWGRVESFVRDFERVEVLPPGPGAMPEDRCDHGMFFSGAGACPECGGGATL